MDVYSTDADSESREEKTVMYKAGTLVLLRAADLMSDVVIGEFMEDVYEGENEASVKIHHNDLDNPLVLITSIIKSIKLGDVLREVALVSLDILSENEYIDLTEKENYQPIPTEKETEETESSEQGISLAPLLIELSSRRQRRAPSWLVNDFILQ